jgi:hypothetical protein
LDGGQVLLLGATRATVKDKVERLVRLAVDFSLRELLVLSEEFWVKADVSRLVDTVNVTETSGDREVWRNG